MSDTTPDTRGDAPAALAVFASVADLPAINDLLGRLRRPVDASHVGGPAQASTWSATQPCPALLLVDIDGVQNPLTALLELATQCGPGTRLIALGSRQDIDFYRQLLSAGIFDYLLKPLRLDVLADTLARADDDVPLGQSGAARVGRTAAFVGTAGGLGCSTLVAALGQWLAGTRQLPTALVDYDRRNGDLPLLLGLEADAGLASVLEAPAIDARLLQRTLQAVQADANAAARLHLLAQRPGTESPVPADRTLEIGGALGQLFSLSLWDVPAHRPAGSDAVLAHAEIRVVITELSVQGARNTHRLLSEIGDESQGQSLLLLSSSAHQAGLPVLEVAQFEDFVDRAIDLHLPHAGNALAASLLQGPLNADAAPAYATAVARLGQQLLGLPQPDEQPAGLTQRLAGLLGLRARHAGNAKSARVSARA
ncbi:hypothetical protein D8I35_10180 [Corticibacter populi]|uniref:Response regulatory domain-containing protein n=1 Tax=Corticibacter populi TaxID=1550736 RepID=A0A3M6QW80_9BURK|nr:MinD/ParA family protein [Corticibacter populi]RMX06849.1 hypothetical protein D8I35_10180 [Corticibacter populi]RZS31560.1 pilus assembly protein CpaE [Corticibacter populi]